MNDKLSDDENLLFRQIHPNFVQDGIPSSQPFVPNANDQGKLSLDRSVKTTAADAFERYLSAGRQTTAVYGVTVKEFGEERIDCFKDPIVADDPKFENLSHAFANYSPFSDKEKKIKAKRIKHHALARGCLHPKEKQNG